MIAMVGEYVECMNCEFVFMAGPGAEPVSYHGTSCPNCDEEEFEFL